MRSTSYSGELKESKHETTSKILYSLQQPSKKLSFCNYIMGKGLNSHLSSDAGAGQYIKTCFKANGFTTLSQDYLAKAIKSGKGFSQTWLLNFPVQFFTDPLLIQQLIRFNGKKLLDSETGGIQERFIGDGTILSLRKTDPRYRPARASAMSHLFTPINELVKPMQEVFDYYMREISETKGEIDIANFSSRLAMTMISKTLLGFDDFKESEKTELSQIVNNIVTKIPNLINTSLLTIETLIRNKTGIRPNLLWSLDKLKNRAEEIMKNVILRNEERVLKKLRSISGDPELSASDLYKPKALTMIKLFLAGGFETTSKLLLHSLATLADPKNANTVLKLREEISKLEKPPEQWTTKDLESLEYLHGFVFEVLRLYPPFSFNRLTSLNDIILAPNIPLCKDKDEYHEKFNDPKRDREDDIFIPKDTIIIISPLHAHRYESIYENATEFMPERWLGKNFSLRDVMYRSDFFTFGNDSRACPGRIFSEQEALLLIARLAANFTIKLNPDLPIPLPLEPGFTLELSPKIIPKASFIPLEKKVQNLVLQEALTKEGLKPKSCI